MLMLHQERNRNNDRYGQLESMDDRKSKMNGSMEQRASSGNIIGLACGPLTKQRYINPKIEAELVDFKKEIEEKFAKSKLVSFGFPRKSAPSPKQMKLPNPSMRSSRFDFSDRKSDRSVGSHNNFLAY